MKTLSKNTIAITVAGLFLFPCLVPQLSATGYESFTATSVSGNCAIAAPGKQEMPAAAKSAYPLGTLVRTGDKAGFAASLSPKNTFRLEPKTTVRVVKTEQQDKESAVCLELEKGKVSVDLADYPKAFGFQVKSPLGRYTVIGTAFSVSYARQAPAREIGILTVTRGEVAFDSDDLDGAAITAGGQLVVIREHGGGATYYEITANGKPVQLTVAGKHHIDLAAGSTIKLGLDEAHATAFAAVAVTAGSAMIGDQSLTPGGGAVFMNRNSILDQQGAAQYLSGVEQIAVISSQLETMKLTQTETAQLKETLERAKKQVAQTGGQTAQQIFRPPFAFHPTPPARIEPQSPSGASLPPSATSYRNYKTTKKSVNRKDSFKELRQLICNP